MKKVTAAILAELQHTAEQNPRRRTNYNLHEQLDDPIQRLCITGEADTVFPVHRHLDKWELMIILKGSLTSYTYNEDGSVAEAVEMAPGGNSVSALEIPAGTWHNCVFHESGTTFLEVKKGPYAPLKPEEIAAFKGMSPEK